MLSVAEREELFASGGEGIKTGTGKASDSAPPELRRLLRE
tara:strand:+ start:1055 stop:1174 length:120 start_codon:yes stop_codon:yes gene_type:complete